MLLIDDERGPIGEFGTDLIEARWASGNPNLGELVLRGGTRFVEYLMDCRSRPLTVVVSDEPEGVDGRYCVYRNTYEYRQGASQSRVAVYRNSR